MSFSIRTRLTFLYSGLLSHSLILFATSAVWLLRQRLTDRVHESLAKRIQGVEDFLRRETTEKTDAAMIPVEIEEYASTQPEGHLIEVTDAAGRVPARPRAPGAGAAVSAGSDTSASWPTWNTSGRDSPAGVSALRYRAPGAASAAIETSTVRVSESTGLRLRATDSLICCRSAAISRETFGSVRRACSACSFSRSAVSCCGVSGLKWSITAACTGKYKMTGYLTMHGVTKPVTFVLDAPSGVITDPMNGARRVGAAASATINRKDFGVNYDSKLPNGTPSVSDEIKIQLDVELLQPAAGGAPAGPGRGRSTN